MRVVGWANLSFGCLFLEFHFCKILPRYFQTKQSDTGSSSVLCHLGVSFWEYSLPYCKILQTYPDFRNIFRIEKRYDFESL